MIHLFLTGLLARQRRGELQKVNEQLRQINAALRRQAKIESYAPTLSYAPVGSRLIENEVIVDPRREEVIARLKAGKSFLRNQDPERAFGEFKAGLELARALKDPTEEKKAVRGLGLFFFFFLSFTFIIIQSLGWVRHHECAWTPAWVAS